MATIKGTVEDIIYKNESNGYVVCELSSEKKSFTAVGYMPFINIGENLNLTGEWVNHPDYGEQLKVETYEKCMPDTLEEIERYLGSGVIKGIGPATAARIVEKFGKETMEIIQYDCQKLSEIKGISLEKALVIGQAFEEQRELRDVVIFFQRFGVSPSYAAKIYKIFGPQTIEQVKQNPYRLADEVIGIGFKTADGIAQNLGIDPVSRFRVISGIKYVLTIASSRSGHVYLPYDQLVQNTSDLLGIDKSIVEDSIIAAAIQGNIHIDNTGDGKNIYLKCLYNYELATAKRLLALAVQNFEIEESEIMEQISEYQKENSIVLAQNQIRAAVEAVKNGVLVITGGPGTGKTTIIKAIINMMEKLGLTVCLAAPTGRAAKRMTETTGMEAKTIHRLLEIVYNPEEEEPQFMRNEENPLDAEAIIIDEMSMVDIVLMNNLLKALKEGTRLVLVGDVDQLPSVGPGKVLKDIIESQVIKTIKLTEVFRQAEESLIVVNAHKINKGEMPILNVKEKDFFFVNCKSQADLIGSIVDLCFKRLPDTYGYDPLKNIQVLTPTRKGWGGVVTLNPELQKVLNPPLPLKKEKAYRGGILRTGDKVMQIKNNYNIKWQKYNNPEDEGIGVFNGDTGIIIKIDELSEKVVVLFDDDKMVEYDYSILDEIEHAFAITVHKSQGSEFPVTVIPVFHCPKPLMSRNLLYTAVTRAKGMVVLVGWKSALEEMIANLRDFDRFSGLCKKLKSAYN